MPLARLRVEGAPERLVVCVARNAEHLVVVTLENGHLTIVADPPACATSRARRELFGYEAARAGSGRRDGGASGGDGRGRPGAGPAGPDRPDRLCQRPAAPGAGARAGAGAEVAAARPDGAGRACHPVLFLVGARAGRRRGCSTVGIAFEWRRLLRPAGGGWSAAPSSSSARVDHFHSSRPWIGTTGAKQRRTTTFTFVLQRSGRDVFTVNQVSPACVGIGRFTFAGHAGLNRARFAGVVHGRRLVPGTYRISIRTASGLVVRRVTLVVVGGSAPSGAEL